MPGRLFQDLPRAITEAGELLPGASLLITEQGSGDVATLYADAEFLVAHPNPLIADGAGRFPPFYFDGAEYRARLYHPTTQAVVWDLNPIQPFPLTEDGVPLDNAGEVMPFARRTFWRSQTTQLQAIYSDEALTTPLDNPLTADADGEFVPVYMDDDLEWRVRLEDGVGRLIYDLDPLQFIPEPPLTMTAGGIEAIGYDLGSLIGSIAGDINEQLPTAQVLTIYRLWHIGGSQIQLRLHGSTSTPPSDVFASLQFTDKDGNPRTLNSSGASSTTPATNVRQWTFTGQSAAFESGDSYELTFTP